MIISQFRTSPLLLFPPFSFLWQVSKVLAYHSSICSSRLVLLISGISFTSPPDCGLSFEKYKELTLLKILDSVSSVLDSWLVLVSTIPKPPNTLILRLVLGPPISRSHTPLSPFNY
ncbi:hypothetical protein N7537_008842 [Penicillium hordei]|uniref:Uncharacterized protein n=1 Tax=Penicillium hordei TaxID=40994 RepID=A0AAD6H214_9EURO|nr:uncharacterized protein N7537_008842 [Penicillium hordei]KAJ5598758.1 hypothetical protein N7537_008842 [Penicillium hordei]